MGYRGESFILNFAEGGYSYDKNVDKIPFLSMVGSSRNLNLIQGGRSRRGGTSPVNETPITGTTPKCWGTYQFKLENGTEFILAAMSTGKIYSNYTTEIATGLTIDGPVDFTTYNNLCIICTGNDNIQVWTGTGSVAALASGSTPADWKTPTFNYPVKTVVHGRGVSERLWAVGCVTRPHEVYASDENPGDGSTPPDFVTGAKQFHIETGDGFGIINGIEYGDRLILSGKLDMYIIDDTSADSADWGYNKAQFTGGTASSRSLIKAENDIFSMTEDGTIYSVTAAQQYGDYKKASLTRTYPGGSPFMDEYIKDKINLSSIANFHAIYDPTLRCVYFFCVSAGKSSVDIALCYFIDRGPDHGWIIKENRVHDSGYKAACSTLVRVGSGNYKIYTGGNSDGFIWEIETTAKNDNGNPYYSGFETPDMNFGDPRLSKRFDTQWLMGNATGGYKLFIDVWIDGVHIKQALLTLSGSSSIYGVGVYSIARYSGSGTIEEAFDIGADGKRIKFNIYNNNVDEDFFVSQLISDFKPLSRRAR